MNSLEWVHWERFLNTDEYSIFKARNSKEGSLTWLEGSLNLRNEFENFTADAESIKHAKKPPLFLKRFKNQGGDLYLRRGMRYWGL